MKLIKHIYYYFKYKKIINFINQNLNRRFPKNQWFVYNKFKVYIRTSYQHFNNQLSPTIEIATIDVYEEYTNKKVFTNFLNLIENTFPNNIIFVENVLNPKLYFHLIEKRNYKQYNIQDKCLYFVKNEGL